MHEASMKISLSDSCSLLSADAAVKAFPDWENCHKNQRRLQ
jgi:hypothetical protein